MKELNLAETFCEILSGLSLLFLLVPLLDLIGVFSLDKSIGLFTGNLTVAGLGALLLVSFFVGTAVVDAVGFAIEQLAGRYLPSDPVVTDAEKSVFWKTASEHVLRYREHQWTYYSCYRNLFIMLLPGGICWAIVVWCRFGRGYAAMVFGATALLEVALYFSMTGVLKLYHQITKYVGS